MPRRDHRDGTLRASCVSFKIETEDRIPVVIQEEQGVLVRYCGKLGVAKVLGIYQVLGIPSSLHTDTMAGHCICYSNSRLPVQYHSNLTES